MANSRHLFRRGWATIYLSREGWPAIHLFCRRLSICLPTYLRGYGHPPTYLGGQPPLPGRAGEPSLLIITNFPAFPLSRSSAFPLSRSSALPLFRPPALPLSHSPALPLARSLYAFGECEKTQGSGASLSVMIIMTMIYE